MNDKKKCLKTKFGAQARTWQSMQAVIIYRSTSMGTTCSPNINLAYQKIQAYTCSTNMVTTMTCLKRNTMWKCASLSASQTRNCIAFTTLRRLTKKIPSLSQLTSGCRKRLAERFSLILINFVPLKLVKTSMKCEAMSQIGHDKKLVARLARQNEKTNSIQFQN